MKIVLIKIVCLLASVISLSMIVDLNNFLIYLENTNYIWLGPAFLFVFVNQLISSFRFGFVLKLFGVHIGFWDLHRINIYSILSGFMFFNFFGQGIYRSILIKKFHNSEVSFIATSLERSISLSILLIGAISVSAYVFGGVVISIPSAPIILVIVFVLLSAVIFYTFVLFPRQRAEINVFVAGGFGKAAWGIVMLVALMHVCMLGAYLSLMLGMSEAVSVNQNSILAGVLTMLGGAIPISFGGWGVREVSAGFAFKAASLPSELGVSAGVGVGLLTIVALACNLLVVTFRRKKWLPTDSVGNQESADLYSKRLTLLLAWVSVPIVIVCMMVQVPISLASSKLAVNLADPIAIVVGMTFALVLLQRRAFRDVWVDKRVVYWLLAAGSVLLLSYVLGLFKLGYSDWALYNRLVGSGVLFSYLIVGLVSTAFWGELAVRVAIRTIWISLPVVAIIEFLARLGLGYDSLLALGWHTPRWAGFLSNPNSFAFFLITVFCIAFPFSKGSFDARKNIMKFAPVAVVVALLFLTVSRSALISFLTISILFAFFDWRRVVYSLFLGMIVYLSILGLNEILKSFADTGAGIVLVDRTRSQFSELQIDRIESLVAGWDLFTSNPLFGAGLGAFYESQTLNGNPLVLHNSFLWILAEMGLLGFSVIVIPPIFFGCKILLRKSLRENPYLLAFSMVLFNAGMMGMAHELVYQRIFWLAFGLLLASPFSLRSRVVKH